MENFKITGSGTLPNIQMQKAGSFGNAVLYTLRAEYEKPCVPECFSVHWQEPNDGAFSVWAPKQFFDRYLQPSWCGTSSTSKANNGVPVFAALDKAGNNVVTYALSDADSAVRLHCDVDERSGKMQVRIDFFTEAYEAISEYEVTVFCCTERKPYYEILAEAGEFLEKYYPPLHVPEQAERRTFSTWYCFQKDIDEERVLKQCELAKEYGMNTVIIDDGWQTEYTTHFAGVYHDIGDWEPCEKKFPDMARTVEKLHAMDMKVLLWIATPFIGADSKVFPMFRGRFLYKNGKNNALFIADPRYADIRQWYADMLAERMIRWKLDGFKLDFIDNFYTTDETMPCNDEMDIPDLNKAVCRLLDDIIARLKQITPEVLIEFRESYIGPAMRQYGNMLRVSDCAYGAMYNRMNGIDMRLLAGKTAIHSDMLMWEYDVSAEKAADQLSALLFIVPQISMLLDRLPEEHRKMLKFYLDFIDDNRDVLLHGKLVPLCPEAFYSSVYAQKESVVIAALYAASSFAAPERLTSLTVVNATGGEKVYVDLGKNTFKAFTVKNCMGEIIGQGVVPSSVAAYHIPHNGMIEFAE